LKRNHHLHLHPVRLHLAYLYPQVVRRHRLIAHTHHRVAQAVLRPCQVQVLVQAHHLYQVQVLVQAHHLYQVQVQVQAHHLYQVQVQVHRLYAVRVQVVRLCRILVLVVHLYPAQVQVRHFQAVQAVQAVRNQAPVHHRHQANLVQIL